MTYHTAKQGGTRFRRFGEVIAELKKVVWLSRREAAYLTGIVLVATLIAGALLGALDFGFSELVNKFLLGG
jgi:preprotein translocase SecE subunit